MRPKALFVVLLMLALCGCAGKMDAKRGLSEEWRLRSLEENFLNFKEGQREQEERGREQQHKLAERIKTVEDSLQRMQEQLGSSGTAKVSQPVVVKAQPEPLQSDYASSASAVDSLAEQKAAPVRASGGMASSSAYTEGMTLVRAERGEEGRKILKEFLEAEPNSALVPNAIYWIGESYYLEKNYAQGILTFKEVTRRFPKHHKAAAALLKIGMSYAMMGEKDNASLYLRALLQDHPKSEPAPAARKKLAELGR